MAAPLDLYVPPTGDEPLDAIEQALVRMLIDLIEEEIREEEAVRAADQQHGVVAAAPTL